MIWEKGERCGRAVNGLMTRLQCAARLVMKGSGGLFGEAIAAAGWEEQSGCALPPINMLQTASLITRGLQLLCVGTEFLVM